MPDTGQDAKSQIKEYYQQVVALGFHDFQKSLPNPQYNYGIFGSYHEQLELVSALVLEEYRACEELISDSSTEREELIEELHEIKKKLEYVEGLKQTEKTPEIPIPKKSEESKRKLLFATNAYGTVMVERDLSWLKRHVDLKTYDSYLELIGKLENGEETFIPTRQRQLIDQFKDLYEVKDYQSRVYYRYVEDYIIIIGAMSKKDDFSKSDRTALEAMQKNSEPYVTTIRQMVKSGENMTGIEQTNLEILHRLYDTSKNRGEKK